MKKAFALLFLVAPVFLKASPPGGEDGVSSIVVRIEGLRKTEGNLVIALFDDANNFLTAQRWYDMVPVTRAGSLEIRIPDLGPGEYAISVYHDTNANGKFDTNAIGIPREPYGFSNNPGVRFRAPRFDEAKFIHSGSPLVLSIRL
jgi:uncharacterized protein (DUF2141 family)